MVEERQAEDRLADLMVRSEELSVLAQYIAAASGSNELLAQARSVSLLADDAETPRGKPKRPVPSVSALRAAFGAAAS